MSPQSFVADTNVPLLANGKGSVGPSCVARCARELRAVMTDGKIVIDSEWRILKEYQNKLSPSGQPGPGDAFLKWVLSNYANPRRCRLVAITPKPGDPEDFEEFPRHRGLRKFDRSDRKFVAVAIADPQSSPILQGFDSKWWGCREALADCGVTVLFLCEEEVRVQFEKKMEKQIRRRSDAPPRGEVD